jgi:hypothetical protein
MSGRKPVYGTLPSQTSIRLITLDSYSKEPTSRHARITITLDVYELTTAPAFDALSYTWGDSNSGYLDEALAIPKGQPGHVYCNGAPIELQPNLFDALEMLCTTSLARESHIWIDAICIDQDNLVEKSSQVQLMGMLYESAASVIVWLGLEDSTTSDAFTVAERLGSVGTVPTSNEHLQALKAPLEKLELSVWMDKDKYAPMFGIEPIMDRQWLAWIAFLHRPYFNRTWVIQEVTLARRITALCGSKTLDWDKFSAALFFWVFSGWPKLHHTELLNLGIVDPADRSGFEKLLTAKIDSGTSAFQLIRTREQSKINRFRFEQLLYNHRFCKATDPRDKIFALLSISRPSLPPFSNSLHAEHFLPDYEVSVERLYTRVARILIESRSDLSLLNSRESNYERSIKTLPSWIPDFSVRQLPSDWMNTEKYKASGELKWQSDGCDYNNSSLNVRGYFAGVVEAHSKNPLGNILSTELWGSICEVARGLQPYYLTR